MKNVFLLLFFVFSSFLYSKGQTLSVLPQGTILACGDNKIVALDPALGEDSTAIIWQWEAEESRADFPPDFTNHLQSLDDCKPIRHDSAILFTSSSGGTGIVRVQDKKILFFAYTPMAHSADTLPGGLVAVANSTHPKGNSLELYSTAHPDRLLWADSLYSGHGVVWNQKHNQLFVLNYNELRTYELFHRKGKTGLVSVHSIRLPEGDRMGGHELSPFGEDSLLVTDQDGIYVYDISKDKFSPFKDLEGVKNIKSINIHPKTNQLIYTKAEVSWWTFNIYTENPASVITDLPFEKMYKVRVVF